MPEVGIDQARLENAYQALADHHNSGRLKGMRQVEPAAFAKYDVSAYDDEWLLFGSPGGFSNRSYLVSGQMVYGFPGWESSAEAVERARVLKAQGATRRPPEPDDEDDADED